MNRVCCGAVKIFMGNKSSPFCTFLKVRVCVAMKAPVGLLSGRAVLRSKMEGRCPDKRYPNKITSEMQTHCRSEVPMEHNIFKN